MAHTVSGLVCCSGYLVLRDPGTCARVQPRTPGPGHWAALGEEAGAGQTQSQVRASQEEPAASALVSAPLLAPTAPSSQPHLFHAPTPAPDLSRFRRPKLRLSGLRACFSLLLFC